MTDILLVYITCESIDQAKVIGRDLLEKRLCACVNIYPHMEPMFFWPPKSGKIDETKEVVLIAKTVESKYQALEDRIHQIHTYDVPCVMAIPLKHVSKKYADWLLGELEA